MTKFSNFSTNADRQPAPVHVAVVDAMSEFCDALQGRHTLGEALAHLVRSVGAECGMVVRSRLGGKPQRVAVHDERRGEPVRPLVASYAADHFGAALENARPGSLWLGSSVAGDGTLADWQGARRMREFGVLILASSPSARDHVELHFRQEPLPSLSAAIEAMLPTLVRAWAKRQAGLVSQAIAGHRTRADVTSGKPILGEANPAQLSRAEFRVCLLLSRGLPVEGVSAELGLARSTVRSHLRSIHCKTGTSSLAELVFRLLETGDPEPAGGFRRL
ncbi:helix-turn-helix transcriptional regulator [Cereibacter azotoformans]|uniref:HTH luxR-type domain-containing protein n=1 Tax=Cereibacter sphaeroides (strain ATCC 17025 / ATH 2.4.3) TaxID=349102 RepID=A4WXK5_CERS5|nr:helix-turn-helix transcriptional regulator [Cereibacter azotoformans]ULB11573.1 helix-turn-helix transcriptional regulator [Cereibacter azotoformans]